MPDRDNAAFNRSIIAYDENSDSKLRKQMTEEKETLEILTGLEIDSAKNGIKQDIEEYVGFFSFGVPRSLFLTYKTIVNSKDGREWYEPTVKKKLDIFFENTEWVILPVDSFNAYFGTSSFDRKWLPEFPESIIEREDYAGLCRYRMFI
ncbi:MAG: hypothetical protein IJK65_06475 [Clostridiales bacterium]|nr:hypothetical protein [Clostridia bacterium]MBQ6271333.1 hypothetical protein [Clostridiales bacterium]MBR0438504.1 hypothetical protein [Clostridia bacterium]